LRAAGTFLLEALSPFEVTHRGFRTANQKLQQLIATLEKRNLDLAEINRKLAVENRQRKRTEKALRESEEYLRHLFHEARRMEEDLRNLSTQILHAQEEERKRISRELHDQVGQALTAVSVMLATLESENPNGSKRPSRKLADAQHLLRQAMEVVHTFAREMRPSILDELGLLPALRSYYKGFTARTGLSVHFRANALAEQLTGEQKTVLFRVAQESLTNVAKHARASQVAVAIRKFGDGICMEVTDNGRSFRFRTKNSHKGEKRLGLLGMQESVRLVNGQFAVKSQPGRGTTVRVVIPFQSAGARTLSRAVQDGRIRNRGFCDPARRVAGAES
jgi:signal transduction histidine kinase